MWMGKYTYCFNLASGGWDVDNLTVYIAWQLILTNLLYLLSNYFTKGLQEVRRGRKRIFIILEVWFISR